MNSKLRSIVQQRSSGFCEYCRVPEQYDCIPFQIDHVIAEKHGGLSEADNLAWSCFECNNFKGPNLAGIDPDTSKVAPLFHPRRDCWEEHFRYDRGLLVGLSDKGRATIACLRLNLKRRVGLRRELIAEGVFFSG